jgi:hypothetical protein
MIKTLGVDVSKLTVLNLHNSSWYDSNLEAISSNLIGIHTLYVGTIAPFQDPIQVIGKFTNIRRLVFANCSKIQNTQLSPLNNLQCLTRLEIPNFTWLVDQSLNPLTALTNLKSLNLSGGSLLSNDSVKVLSILTNLTKLNLSGCTMINKGCFEYFKKFAHLKVVNFSDLYLLKNVSFKDIPTPSECNIIYKNPQNNLSGDDLEALIDQYF